MHKHAGVLCAVEKQASALYCSHPNVNANIPYINSSTISAQKYDKKCYLQLQLITMLGREYFEVVSGRHQICWFAHIKAGCLLKTWRACSATWD